MQDDYSLKEVDSEELRELLAAESEPMVIESQSPASDICSRIQALRNHGLKQALPALMLELERIARENLEADDRITVMRCVKKPVLKAAAGLPKPRISEGKETAAITLEQRLILLMIYNLRKTLHEVDRTQSNQFSDDDSDRIWVLQQLFRFFSRQIRYSVDFKRPCPQHTWRDLHDLFVYLVVRGMVQLSSDFSVSVFDEDFDAEIEYKRALLLGVVDRLTHHRAQSDDFFHLLKRWASDSRLQDPNSLIGQAGLIKVEVTHDESPQLYETEMTEAFRGWVLRPPEEFREYIDNFNAS